MLVVVGGHSRNIGKTSVVAGLIRTLRGLRWTGVLSCAAGVIQKLIAQNRNLILESNSVVELVEPALLLMVLDFSCRDFKPSCLRILHRADALVVVNHGVDDPDWPDVDRGLWEDKPRFLVDPPDYVTPAVTAFVREKLAASAV